MAGALLSVDFEVYGKVQGRAGSMDCHDYPPPLLPIRHRSRQVLCVASRILAELLDVGLRLPILPGASMRRGPLEHVAYELVSASPAVSGVSCSPPLSLALLADTPARAETLLPYLEKAARGIGLYVNSDKTEYMCFGQNGDIVTLDGVLFRKHLQEMAKNNGCVGWVQNTKRGTVIGQLQGSPEGVKIVKDWLKKTGSPKSRIERCVFKNEIEIKKLEHSDFLVIK